MPANSIRIGVDLDSIKPIPGCITFQGDITTQKCVNTIRKELKHFQADVVLNDGAPNVGAQWGKDAFTQTELVLHAAKIANLFLRKGGTFVSKVFRSRDYTTLISVLRQMFERVDTTKPQASRQSSAEIFVVCLNFKAQKQDPKLFDPKVVFASGSAHAGEAEALDQERMKIASLKQFLTKKVNRGGYEDNTKQYIYESAGLSEFIKAEEPFEFLRKANRITLKTEEDQKILERVKPNKMTVKEFEECCQDIKVLGKTELSLILKYRERVRRILAKDAKRAAKAEIAEQENEKEETEIDSDQEDKNELERIIAVKEQEKKKLARKKEERKKKGLIGNKMAVLGASLSKNQLPAQDDENFQGFDQELREFLKENNIEDIERKPDLSEEEQAKEEAEREEEESELDPYEDDFLEKKIDKMEEEINQQYKRRKEEQSLLTRKEVKKRAREEEEIKQILEEGVMLRKEDRQELEEKEDDSDYSEEEEEEEEDEDEGEELDQEEGQEEEDSEQEEEQEDEQDEEEEEEDEQEGDESQEEMLQEDEDVDEVVEKTRKGGKKSEELLKISKQWFDQDFFTEKDFQKDLVKKGLDPMPTEKSEREQRKEKLKKQREKDQKKEAKQREAGTGGTLGQLLDTKAKIQQVPKENFDEYDSDDIAQTVAIAKKMTRKKDRREILEASYNRYCFAADDNAPEWFREDQLMHYRPNMPVTKEEVQAQKQALREYNARPIKKVAEAKIRKKKRLQKAMQKAKSKAMQIANQSEISEASKARQIETIYKKTKAKVEQKREKQYVVSSKGGAKKAARSGQKKSAKKGKQKVVTVDPRMKKDKRGEKRAALRKKKRFH